MTTCPHCRDSLGHPGLTECPESGRPLPASPNAGAGPAIQSSAEPSDDRAQICPHCRAPGGHPGLVYCPDTVSRLPVSRSMAATADVEALAGALEAGGSPMPAAERRASNDRPTTRDPFAAYDKAWLLEISGQDPIGLDDGESVLLGRDPASPISLSGADNISRRHAEILVRDGELFAVDLHSSNGTFLNGVILQPGTPTPCHDGDTVQLATEDPVRIRVSR